MIAIITKSAPEYLAQMAIARTRPPSRARRQKARVTVWYPSGPITGGWHAVNLIQWAAVYYEYLIGIPATVEYADRQATLAKATGA